jgi:hypothetical protein
MGQITGHKRPSGGNLGGLLTPFDHSPENRQGEGAQKRDNRDNNQQLDQRECGAESFLHKIGNQFRVERTR